MMTNQERTNLQKRTQEALEMIFQDPAMHELLEQYHEVFRTQSRRSASPGSLQDRLLMLPAPPKTTGIGEDRHWSMPRTIASPRPNSGPSRSIFGAGAFGGRFVKCIGASGARGGQ
jgi:hypothetical protein